MASPDDEDIHPAFPIEPGTPEEEEATVVKMAEFLQINGVFKDEDEAISAAIELIAKMRAQIKSEQLNG